VATQVAHQAAVQDQQQADLHQLRVDFSVALIGVAVIAAFLGWFVAGRVLRPLRAITAAARRISATNLHERLALKGANDEFKRLGDTLDDLFARLEAAFEAQRHFVANASHELRTPVTRERALLALADSSTPELWQSVREKLLASNHEQERLIEALLALASSEGGLDHRERTDLADICEAVLSRPTLGTERLGLAVEASVFPAPLEGDPTLLERLVANLVDNAVGHNVAGGHVKVSTGMKEDKAMLSVTNTGPFVPPREVDRLFQPFQRLDGRRTHHKNGHGLGLSIVRAIVAAHGGTITADSLPGGGLTVDVTFPAPADPDGITEKVLRAPANSSNELPSRKRQRAPSRT
jgi:signal transduction histidine kinase